MILSDKDLDDIIRESLHEAELELSDSGKTLNIACDFKNGNTDTCSTYSQQIDKNEFTEKDMVRYNRLNKLCGLSV